MNKQDLLQQLSDQVLNMEDEKIIPVAQTYVEQKFPIIEGIINGLADGMNRAGKLCDEDVYFIPELLGCADAMYAGLDILKPHLPQEAAALKKPKVVIGVVEGDTHDIGKNLVKLMLEASGFETYDLGRDVILDQFIEKAEAVKADIICLSTLMSTTMEGMRTIINKLKAAGLRDKYKIMIGGSCISQSFADNIGADGYSANSTEAVLLAKSLLNS